jgi:bacillolysin
LTVVVIGALIETICDVFGTTSIGSYWIKKSPRDTWLIGEDLYMFGGAHRIIANPFQWNKTDYYPDSYTGTYDYGGIHINMYACSELLLLVKAVPFEQCTS